MARADVLDLFAGSGAFGLEALSRGARDARMVDFSRLSCAAARANLVKTGLEGGTVIQGDAVQFVRRELLAGRKYDIIFPDPPYCKGPVVDGAQTYDYTLPMAIFAIFGVLALIVSLMLKAENRKKGYGLEEANIKKESV